MKLIESVKSAGKGVTLETSVSQHNAESDYVVDVMINLGEKIKPHGMTCVGVATVFYYERTDGRPGGAFQCVTGIGGLNEVFADGGIKQLNQHCAKVFGRKAKGMKT